MDSPTQKVGNDTQAILNAIAALTERFDKSEERITEKLNRIEDSITNTNTRIDDIDERVTKNESELSEITDLKDKYKQSIMDMENKAVMCEYHSMKFNLILFKIPQIKDDESHEDLMTAVTNFFVDIDVPNILTIHITAIHRLKTRGGTMPLPIIFKLGTLEQRDRIFKAVSANLKGYNKSRKTGNKVGVKQQLPFRMLEDKRSLKNEFQDAYDRKLKPKWKLNRTTYRQYLQIGDKVVLPKVTTDA